MIKYFIESVSIILCFLKNILVNLFAGLEFTWALLSLITGKVKLKKKMVPCFFFFFLIPKSSQVVTLFSRKCFLLYTNKRETSEIHC